MSALFGWRGVCLSIVCAVLLVILIVPTAVGRQDRNLVTSGIFILLNSLVWFSPLTGNDSPGNPYGTERVSPFGQTSADQSSSIKVAPKDSVAGGPSANIPSPQGQEASFSASPNPTSPDRPVTLTWHFVGDKIVISGGRFAKGVDVTTRKFVVDKPHRTTRYRVDVWYRTEKVVGKPNTPSRKVHAFYEVVVTISSSSLGSLKLYTDQQGWKLKYPAGWRHDVVHLPDPSNNSLVYFQKEEDRVERLAVSMLPAPDGGAETLLKKLKSSVYSSYSNVKFISEAPTTFAGTAATWLVFSGSDDAHPGVATQSMAAIFVKGTRAYVVSARTRASNYASRSVVLEQALRTFFTADN